MKTTISIILTGLIFLTSCSTSTKHIRKGNMYYENIAYANAIHHYEKAYAKGKSIAVANNLAISYMNIGDYDNAQYYFERIIDEPNVDKQAYFNYGKILMGKNKHNEAARWFNKYLDIVKHDVVAEMLLSACLTVNDRYIDTTLYKLRPILSDEFTNTFGIIEYKDGAVFSADKEVFSGRKKNPWTGNSYLDLYVIEKDDEGNWLNPALLKGDVNGPFHDGPATFSEDGQIVYFTRSNYFKRKMKTNENNENNLKIFKATMIDGKYKNLEELPFNSDDYSVGHPTLSYDGKTLYFVSDMPGGFGGTDIYKVNIDENGNYSKPENLGNSINTAGNEMFPYLHRDGTLYFSSNAHNSMGGLDVFISYHNGERWVTPENLNYPINSIKDDFAFSLNKDNISGFVSSSRVGNDAMYSFTKQDPTFNLFGTARKKGTDIPVEGVTVRITVKDTEEVINMVSDKTGKFKLKLKPETEYLLLCTKEGCFTRTDNVSTKGLKYSENFYADFQVEEIIIDKPIVLENIYYDFDKWNIREDAAIELDKLTRLLNDNPTIEIEMGSHTDARGSDAYNMLLSQKRAMAAVQYLVRNGIAPNRLTWKGYGETVPVNKCVNDVACTEKEHQQNRRTEFKVTKINK
jgi:peptidoglycan-associated lipoprotein